jgi:hypothetical protein
VALIGEEDRTGTTSLVAKPTRTPLTAFDVGVLALEQQRAA